MGSQGGWRSICGRTDRNTDAQYSQLCGEWMPNLFSIARYARKMGVHSTQKPVTFYVNDADDAANAKQYLFQENKPAGNT